MEEWLALEGFDPESAVWATGLRATFRRHDPTGLGFCTRFICGILEREEKLEGLHAYGLVRIEVTRAYLTLEASHEGLDAEWERIQHIVRAMYDMEDGLAQKMGVYSITPITPDMSPADHERCLWVLDNARLRFKRVFLDAFQVLPTIADRNLLMTWGRNVYYKVHGFQAPARTDPAQAMRDAAGGSDHFEELMQEVLAESPEGV